MKFAVDGIGEIAALEILPDKKTGDCELTIRAFGYEVVLPGVNVCLTHDKDENGLLAEFDFQGLAKGSMFMGLGDIKSMKELMNKSVLGFMVKALM